MPLEVKASILNSKEIDAVIKRARGVVKDLRPAFKIMASDFQKGNRAIFKLQGPGQYDDFVGRKVGQTWKSPGRPDKRTRDPNLTPYQNYKVARGFAPEGYPLLKLSGRLEKSLTQPGGDSILKFGLTNAIFGTKVKNERGKEYASYLQNGTSKMPARAVVFLRPGDGAPDGIAKRRLGRWLNILNDYILKEMGAQTRLPVVNDGKGIKE